MWRNGSDARGRRWVCAVKEGARNKTRIRVNGGFIGREHQFPAPREEVVAFVRRLREESGLWPA